MATNRQKSEAKVRVGVIGCGTVGAHSIRALIRRRPELREKTGLDFVVVRVADQDKARRRFFPKIFTPDARAVIEDPAIDILVELIGGVHPAYEFITAAMEQGKSVVTANKALLSDRGGELFRRAESGGVHLGFEASVGGAIPIIKTLRESFAGNVITRLLGILNGTTNYVLSQMTHRSMEFADALELARKKGYAEANPHFDISGLDTAHKLSILARFAFNKEISWKDIPVEGIERLEKMDIDFAREFGYRIKLLAIARRQDHHLEVRVHPTLLPQTHLLTLVEDVHNAVYLEGDLIGRSLLYGEGAGGYAAASSVISDVVEIGMKLKQDQTRPLRFPEDRSLTLLSPDEVRTRHYCRFTALDRPGVLATIARVLGERGISIASVRQKGENPEKAVPIVMLTHYAREKDVRTAIARLDRMNNVIKQPTVRMRVED